MTLLDVINRTADFFQKKGLESPRLQIELLLAHVLKLPRMQLYLQFERELQESEAEQLRPLVKRRADREPLQYIIGQVTFDGLKLECAPGVLIPRPETELLVDLIKKDLQGKPAATLADVGTGSGAIALSLAKALPDWKVLAIEPQPEAAALFQKNLLASGLANVSYVNTSLLEGLEETVQVVVANLPYLTSEEVKNLQPELKFEPALALDGGPDGLELIRPLIAQLPDCVKQVYLELGISQSEEVICLLLLAGFPHATSHQDLLGHHRFVIASRSL